MNWPPFCFCIKPVISGVMVPIARLLGKWEMRCRHCCIPMTSGQKILFARKVRSARISNWPRRLWSQPSSSHEEDWNESFLRVSAAAEMIKQDRFEAYAQTLSETKGQIGRKDGIQTRTSFIFKSLCNMVLYIGLSVSAWALEKTTTEVKVEPCEATLRRRAQMSFCWLVVLYASRWGENTWGVRHFCMNFECWSAERERRGAIFMVTPELDAANVS